jgi:hypothetical protein
LSNDPDRGSYKLTLTSNEDSINHNVYPDEILSAKCNLPDVLPVGVKYQNTRYPAMNVNSHTNYNNSQPPTPKSAQTAPAVISSNQSKSIFHFPIGSSNYNHQHPHNPSFSHSHNNLSHHQKVSPTNGPPIFQPHQAQPQQPPTQYPSYNSALVNSKTKSCSNDAISPKYQSQSTFDLKKTQIIESQMFTTNEDIFKEQHAEQKELETPFEYCVMNMTSQSGLQPFSHNGGCANVQEDNDDDDDDNVQLQQQQQPATINKSEIAKKLNFEKIESTTNVNNNHINSNITNNINNSRDTIKEVNQNNSPISVNCSNNSNSNNIKNINSLLNVEKDMVMTCTTGSQTTTPTKDQQYVKNYNSCNNTNNSVVVETEAAADMMSDIDAQQTPTVTNAILIETTSLQAAAATTNNSNCDTDSLKLMQRSELVLRLNASTAETACQTDESIAAMVQGIETLSIAQIVFSARQKTAEEVDCEKLSQDLVSQLSTTDKLHNVLGKCCNCRSLCFCFFINQHDFFVV